MGLLDSFSDVGNAISSGLQAIGSFYGTNLGINNKIKWLDEGLGEITGRNQSRAALNLARDQFNYAQQQANNLVVQQNWNSQQKDILSSSAAGAARANAVATGGINYNNATPTSFGPGAPAPMGGQKDFLGL